MGQRIIINRAARMRAFFRVFIITTFSIRLFLLMIKNKFGHNNAPAINNGNLIDSNNKQHTIIKIIVLIDLIIF